MRRLAVDEACIRVFWPPSGPDGPFRDPGDHRRLRRPDRFRGLARRPPAQSAQGAADDSVAADHGRVTMAHEA